MNLVDSQRYPAKVFDEMFNRYTDELVKNEFITRTCGMFVILEDIPGKNRPQKLYLAEKGLGPVGLMRLIPKEDGKEAVLYILDLYIEPEYRGRGYGTAALKKMAEKYPGADAVAYCDKSNQPGIRFFNYAVQKCGFKRLDNLQAPEYKNHEKFCFRTGDIMENRKMMLNAAEAAAVLGVGRTTLYRNFLSREDFPKIKVGRRLLIPKKELEKWSETIAKDMH